MEFGRNKIVMIEILIAILGCILVVTVHYFCCKWYMFASLLSGYATIIIAKKHLKETWDNSYPLGSETLSEKKRWRLVLIRDDLDPDKARTIEPGDGWLSLVPVKE